MRSNLALLLAIPAALVAAGCVTPPDDIEAAATNDASAATIATAPAPYSFDGSFGPEVWACPVITCEGFDPASDRWAALDIAGNLTAINLTMTWDATSPLMETLRFGISWGENGEDYEYVEGTSPLLLELTGIDITSDHKPYIWTWVVPPTPVELVYLSTPTDFHIEGELTLTETSA